MTRPGFDFRSLWHRVPITLLVLGACIIWASWSILAQMQQRWSIDPTYSHGYLVPLVALVLLWARRDRMPAADPMPNWWGVGFAALGVAMQLTGSYYYVRWLSGAAIVAYIGGAVVLVLGWKGLRWAAPAIGFLLFMIPLPYRIDMLMRYPLQRISTLASGVALQMLGLPAVVEGNLIALDDVELGVVDACSGLKMFIIFFCLSTAIALLAQRHLFERILIVLSAAPIAIVCNVARITATGVAYQLVGEKTANLIYHDLAGWLMMPLALLLLWGELWLMSVLFIEYDESARPAFRLSEMIPVAGDSASASANRPSHVTPA